MRISAIILTFLILSAGVFFTQQFFAVQYASFVSDQSRVASILDDVLVAVLVLGIAAAFFFSLFVYTALTTQDAAKRRAYVLSRDISYSKEQFRKFYDLSPVPFLIIDPHGRIDRPNKAALRFFGVNEDVLRQKNLLTLLTIPEHPEKLALYKERISRHVPIEQVEVQVTKDSGVVRWALLSVEDLTTPEENKHQGLVTIVDIHDQKELERMKTEFLSLASHQLRAPLANLKWYIDFLLTRRAQALSGDVLTYLHKMYRRNEDMIELVNTFLNLSRIEMGRVKVDLAEADLSTLIRSVAEELEPAAKEKEISVEINVGEAFALETDGKLVRIIVQNLLSNALRYTPNGGKVAITLTNAGNKRASIEVTDSGIGIPPEEQTHIFSKLYRAANAKEMEVNGNGIGLYMCKALAESMGGSIDFVSVLGKGTTFTLKL